MKSASPADVLVVDDDADLRHLLSTYLGANGLQVRSAHDGPSMREQLALGLPDLIVLDLMMPGEDGLTLTRWLKARHPIPILMLSARGEEIDRVIGLEVGVDDYLPKPFSPRELLARARALMRRQAAPPAVADPADAPLRFGPFSLDTTSRTLWRDGHEVALTTAEFELLQALASRPLRVLSRDTLVDLLKGFERDPFDRSIDNRVTRLRRKIEADPTAPRFIRTVRGEGYLFNPQAGPHGDDG